MMDITAVIIPGVAVLGGMLATIIALIGLIIRSGKLTDNQELPIQQRPESLTGFPFVTIIVPARNEERNIAQCLDSLLGFDYPSFEILVIDDHSTDRTVEIVREFIEKFPNKLNIRLFELDTVESSIDGVQWAHGKSRALWHGAQHAQGQWILFVDADTRQASDTLWRTIDFSQQHNLDALSMSGVIVNSGVWGSVLEAVILPAIFLAIPWHRVNKSGDQVAWMNGNFILYRRSAYFEAGGHRAIAGFVQDDLALALEAKLKGVRFRFLPVSSAYKCHDYVGLKEAFGGWSRRLAVGGARLHLNRRFHVLAAGSLFLIGVWPLLEVGLAVMGPLAGIKVLGLGVAAWALIQIGAVVLLQGIMRAVMRMHVWPAVFAPIGALLAIGVVAKGYWERFVKKGTRQRGRSLAVTDDIE